MSLVCLCVCVCVTDVLLKLASYSCSTELGPSATPASEGSLRLLLHFLRDEMYRNPIICGRYSTTKPCSSSKQ
jgi:hypothetical protein